jgi:chromosome segregation ATPase
VGFNVRVTQYQRVFEKLIAGNSIDETRRDIPSASAMTRGIQMYNEYWQEKMPELQREIEDLVLRRKELEDDLQRVSRGVGDAEIRREDLERELKVRREERDELDMRMIFSECPVGLEMLRSGGRTWNGNLRFGGKSGMNWISNMQR